MTESGSRSVWAAIVERGRPVSFAAGSVLVHRGSPDDHCYAIREGEVLVTVSSRQGATVVIARRGPGDIIGDLAALSGLPRTATVTAAVATDALHLTAAELRELLHAEPDLAVAELERVAKQLRDLTERYAVRGDELRRRVLTVLETSAAATGDPVFRSTREELAGWVGATREAVARMLRDLESEGAVRLARGSVELLMQP